MILLKEVAKAMEYQGLYCYQLEWVKKRKLDKCKAFLPDKKLIVEKIDAKEKLDIFDLFGFGNED